MVRRAADELPSDLDDLRKGLEAFGLLAVLFGAGRPEELCRLERYRSLPVGRGVGAKMLAAIAAQDWMSRADPSTSALSSPWPRSQAAT